MLFAVLFYFKLLMSLKWACVWYSLLDGVAKSVWHFCVGEYIASVHKCLSGRFWTSCNPYSNTCICYSQQIVSDDRVGHGYEIRAWVWGYRLGWKIKIFLFTSGNCCDFNLWPQDQLSSVLASRSHLPPHTHTQHTRILRQHCFHFSFSFSRGCCAFL